MEIRGFCDERFSGVLKAFENNFANNHEVGACFAANGKEKVLVKHCLSHSAALHAGL